MRNKIIDLIIKLMKIRFFKITGIAILWFLYPVYYPLKTCYGAACAALILNHQSKADLYHDKFNHQWDAWMNDPDLKGYCFTYYLGCKNFLDKHVPALKD